MPVFFLSPLLSMGISENALADPRHKEQLNGYINRAKDLEAKNLNRFSMEVLYQYDKIYDSLYAAEKKDTLARIASRFESDNREKLALSDSLDAGVKKQSAEKEELRVKYFGLLQKAIVALVVWLIIVTAILYFRTKAMRKYKSLQAGSEASRSTYQALQANGESLIQLESQVATDARVIAETSRALSAIQEEIKQKVKNGEWTAEQAKAIQGKLNEVGVLCEKQNGILQALHAQSHADSETREVTDMNALCMHYLDLAASGVNPETMSMKVSTDFEKRLPQIKVFPRAIGHLLMNLLSNSIQSMQEKTLAGDKNYKPALAVSTRVLPRFLQIRIKDNGTGIPDAELENVLESFYSLHAPEKGAGLGLAEAQRIMNEIHQGEISIESDKERGTDVYLKFFTGNEKA